MNLVIWVLMGVLVGLMGGFAVKRGHGWAWDIALGLIGSVAASWVVQSQWVAPYPSLLAMILAAAGGATGLIIAQRTIFPAPGTQSGASAPASNQRRVVEEESTWKA